MSMVVSANPKTTTKIDKRIRDQDPMTTPQTSNVVLYRFFCLSRGFISQWIAFITMQFQPLILAPLTSLPHSAPTLRSNSRLSF